METVKKAAATGGARQDLAGIAQEVVNLYESHQFYPVLHYFRFRETHYAMARVALVAMDAATLIRSGLDEERYASLMHSAAVAALWGSGQQLLEALSASFLADSDPGGEPGEEALVAWRERYHHALVRFRAGGIAVAEDAEAGADSYVSLRRQWDRYVFAFAEMMVHAWEEVAPLEINASKGDEAEGRFHPVGK